MCALIPSCHVRSLPSGNVRSLSSGKERCAEFFFVCEVAFIVSVQDFGDCVARVPLRKALCRCVSAWTPCLQRVEYVVRDVLKDRSTLELMILEKQSNYQCRGGRS